jgi:glycosyltransferase involved in cell wall biosynthesis
MVSKQILVLSGVRGDTRRYRIFHLYEQLSLAGLPVSISHITDHNLLKKVKDAQVIILHRAPYDPQVDRLVRQINDNNGLLILDVDDLVFAPQAFSWIDSPDFRDSVRASLYKEDLYNNGRTLEASHAVIASTGFLADVVRHSGKPVWVHRNAYSLEMLAHSARAFANIQRNKSKVILGYASGSPTHNKDFGVIRRVLIHILRQNQQVELLLIGPLDPGTEWDNLSNRIHRHKLVPWRKLPEIITKFDINLAPLVADNPFSQSKSEIKWMEAGLLCVPTVASSTDAFKFAISDGENGYLTYTEEDWFNKLTNLVNSPEDRIKVGERAYHDIFSNYHPAARALQLVNTLNEIYQRKYGIPLVEKIMPVSEMMDKSDKISFLSSEIEKHPTLYEMAWYNLRQHGVTKLLRQVWAYTRRTLAFVIPYKTHKNQ